MIERFQTPEPFPGETHDQFIRRLADEFTNWANGIASALEVLGPLAPWDSGAPIFYGRQGAIDGDAAEPEPIRGLECPDGVPDIDRPDTSNKSP